MHFEIPHDCLYSLVLERYLAEYWVELVDSWEISRPVLWWRMQVRTMANLVDRFGLVPREITLFVERAFLQEKASKR